mmetsp:Transcript_53573/g.131230  ORF Transcript_53573/g.131230 Transcript_53573/m.131230 type:complete len:89 (-) Transcript_53573:216-482(-)
MYGRVDDKRHFVGSLRGWERRVEGGVLVVDGEEAKDEWMGGRGWMGVGGDEEDVSGRAIENSLRKNSHFAFYLHTYVHAAAHTVRDVR